MATILPLTALTLFLGPTGADGDGAKAQTVIPQRAGIGQAASVKLKEKVFSEAEAARRQGSYRRAAALYQQVISEFPAGGFGQKANQHLFDIANYWLDDTRAAVLTEENLTGARRVLFKAAYRTFHGLLLPNEALALRTLEQVYANDPKGPNAVRALFYLGSASYLKEDFSRAAPFFDKLHRAHPESAEAPRALEMAIICKLVTLDRAKVEREKLAEVRRLLEVMRQDYPNHTASKADFLSQQERVLTIIETSWDSRRSGGRERPIQK
jgi:TolA-binding protein